MRALHRPPTRKSLFVVLVVVCALVLAVYLRAKAPPEAARLLPECDAIVYANIAPLRTAIHFDTAPTANPVQRSPEFQRFIDATGIVPERDLDTVAFGLHRMPDPHGPNGPVAYSEVFTGHFNALKLARYLHTLAAVPGGGEGTYAGHTVYLIPSEGRSLRVSQLAYDTIAASNMPTAEQLHAMLDRSRASALGTPGSSLLAAHFHDVPLLAQAWGIGHIGLPFGSDSDEPRDPDTGNTPASNTPASNTQASNTQAISLMGLELPVSTDTDLVASLRYSGAEHLLSGGAVDLKVEEFAADATAAEHTVDTLTTLLGILRGLSNAESPHNDADAAMRAIIASIRLTTHGDHALLHAEATAQQLRALFSAHNPAAGASTPAR